MATAIEQARYRAQDSKHLVQIRLSTETVEQLDALVRDRRASGRAEIVAALLKGEIPAPGHHRNSAEIPDTRPSIGGLRLSADGLRWE